MCGCYSKLNLSAGRVECHDIVGNHALFNISDSGDEAGVADISCTCVANFKLMCAHTWDLRWCKVTRQHRHCNSQPAAWTMQINPSCESHYSLSHASWIHTSDGLSATNYRMRWRKAPWFIACTKLQLDWIRHTVVMMCIKNTFMDASFIIVIFLKRRANNLEDRGKGELRRKTKRLNEVESWLQLDVFSNYSKPNKDYRLRVSRREVSQS